MAKNNAGLETRPVEPRPNDTPGLTPRPKNDARSQPSDGKSKDREAQEAHKLSAPLPRWPFAVVGFVVAIFAAVVLYIIFRPHPNVRTNDAYVTAHYAMIAPRISGQVVTVLVDDNDSVKSGQMLLTYMPLKIQQSLSVGEE